MRPRRRPPGRASRSAGRCSSVRPVTLGGGATVGVRSTVGRGSGSNRAWLPEGACVQATSVQRRPGRGVGPFTRPAGRGQLPRSGPGLHGLLLVLTRPIGLPSLWWLVLLVALAALRAGRSISSPLAPRSGDGRDHPCRARGPFFPGPVPPPRRAGEAWDDGTWRTDLVQGGNPRGSAILLCLPRRCWRRPPGVAARAAPSVPRPPCLGLRPAGGVGTMPP